MKQDTIQDLRTLESRIFDAVQEIANDNDTSLGVAIDKISLGCQVCSHEDATAHKLDWFDAASLMDNGELCYDAVADVAAQFCFVR